MIREHNRISAFIAQENAASYARCAMNPPRYRYTTERDYRIYNQLAAAIWYARARRALGIEE